jgi:hypothetical protein
LLPTHSFAQNATGLNFDDLDLIAELVRPELTRSIPPSFVDFSPRMPPPADQGDFGTCISFALAYATVGYYLAHAHNVTPGDPAFTPSPAYLHTRIFDKSEPCEEAGANISDAANYFIRGSVPNGASVSYDTVCSPAVQSPQATRIDDHLKELIYLYVKKKEVAGGIPEANFTAIKQALASGTPVPIGVELACDQLIGDGCIDTLSVHTDKGEALYHGSLATQVTEKTAGGHAMVAVGYDDRRRAIRVQNSWGTDFADGGFFWMSYDAFRADARWAAKPVFSKPLPPPSPVSEYVPSGLDLDPCNSLTEVNGVVSGTVATPADQDALLAELSRNGSSRRAGDITVRPWPICAAHKVLSQPLTASYPPDVTKLDGRTTVPLDGELGFEVVTPDYPSFLYLVYLQSDGSVVNLVPRNGPIRAQHPPRSRLVFGDGQQERQRFYAVAPLGTEAVIAIAARAPIFELEELEDTQSGQYRIEGPDEDSADDDLIFLRILSEALAQRPDPDNLAREISASILHLTITE